MENEDVDLFSALGNYKKAMDELNPQETFMVSSIINTIVAIEGECPEGLLERIAWRTRIMGRLQEVSKMLKSIEKLSKR